jgi:hypothetical protein
VEPDPDDRVDPRPFHRVDVHVREVRRVGELDEADLVLSELARDGQPGAPPILWERRLSLVHAREYQIVLGFATDWLPPGESARLAPLGGGEDR